MSLFIAMLLDAALGEPKWLFDRVPHPAVLMGRLIAWCDKTFNTGASRQVVGVIVISALTFGAFWLGGVLRGLPFGQLIEIALAAILLAQRSLVDHVADVAAGLRSSLAEGRGKVAMIVGRDTAEMDADAVSRGAIESAAENLSDGVIAPAFWFFVLGLPGILAYKIINTADSMIGYKTPRHQEFGWAAAKLDDLVNWVPARLTALLILAGQGRFDVWDIVQRDSRLHRSPNAGWPEAAMAGVLGISLSGPRSYEGTLRDEPYVNEAGRAPGPDDIDCAVSVLWRAWGITLLLAMALSWMV